MAGTRGNSAFSTLGQLESSKVDPATGPDHCQVTLQHGLLDECTGVIDHEI